jgi:hypothetical protein
MGCQDTLTALLLSRSPDELGAARDRAVRAFMAGPGGPPGAACYVRTEPLSLTPTPRGWVRHADDSGVSIDTPATWTFNADPVPALAGPVMLFAVGTLVFGFAASSVGRGFDKGEESKI